MTLQVLLETGLLLVFLLAVGGECLGLCPDHQVVPLDLVHLGPGQPVPSHRLDAFTSQVHGLAFPIQVHRRCPACFWSSQGILVRNMVKEVQSGGHDG